MYSSCSIALITKYMQEIEHKTTGVISVICHAEQRQLRRLLWLNRKLAAAAVPFSHRSRQRTVGTAYCRTTFRPSRRDASVASIPFHSLRRLAVLRVGPCESRRCRSSPTERPAHTVSGPN